MKYKIIFIVLTFLLAPLSGYSQTWKTTLDLEVDVEYGDRTDLFTNVDGNHVLIHDGSSVVYRLFTYDGSAVRNQTIASSISEDERLAKISGYNGYIYVSYKDDDYIYTKRSTNAGQSWSNMESIEMEDDVSNGMELWADGNGLHLTWSEYDNSKYDTYYKRIPHNQTYWTDDKRVTDSSGDEGGFPSVTTSANRVHVAYTQGTESNPIYNYETSKTRDKYSSSWQSTQTVHTNTMRSNIIAGSSKLHLFYYNFVVGGGNWSADLYYKNRDLGSTSWSSAVLIQDDSDPDHNLIDMALSTDDKIHIVYVYSGDIRYKNWNNGSWSSSTTLLNGDGIEQKIYTNSNDIYTIWNDYDDETICLKQCDSAPLAPQSLTITTSQDDHPLLQWDSNTEADLRRYRVYRLNGDANMFYVTGTSFEDEDVEVSQNGTTINYEVKAEDWTSNLSTASNQASINGILGKRFVKNETDSGLPENFQLFQNYPNPFNPNTNITFALPQEEFVSLTVYNLKGQKLASLLNEYKEAGAYSVSFNGQSLSSGIYLYKINAGEFSVIKRMLLVK